VAHTAAQESRVERYINAIQRNGGAATAQCNLVVTGACCIRPCLLNGLRHSACHVCKTLGLVDVVASIHEGSQRNEITCNHILRWLNVVIDNLTQA